MSFRGGIVASKIPREMLDRISKVTNKRARLLLDTIVRRGIMTTEELKEAGYEHPPRAARDVRELGFPLVTTRVKGSEGKPIAAYSLDMTLIGSAQKTGRAQLPKAARDAFIAAAGNRCQICGATHDLQIDHRVPYEIAGESLSDQSDAYMVLDGSCNRRKSWTCEHCENFKRLKSIVQCQTCYWANPEQHTHVALDPIRRLELVWQRDEAAAFDAFLIRCGRDHTDPASRIKEFVKSLK